MSAPTSTTGQGSSFVTFGQRDPLAAEVRHLLNLMRMLDPTGSEERNEEWPLQLRGDEEATAEVCACLNRLQELTK